MQTEIGQVEAIYRYPVKSMAGERLEVANLGWHGIEGDRRLAFRRVHDHSGFPWLTATKLPELILFAPQRRNDVEGELPTHIRTPDGEELEIFGKELAKDVERRHGSAVQMIHIRHGIFDDASISVIATDTLAEIGRLSGHNIDVRRFRPNILLRASRSLPFQEDGWLGGVLSFGEGDEATTVAVTMHDIRCSMVNLDPDTAIPAPEILKAVVRANENRAGVYGTITQTGQIRVGQPVFLHAARG